MIDRFDAQAGADRPGGRGRPASGLTPYEVITIASIVEKEGVYDKNMGPVARVIYNRLAKSMPLQMDSTVLYAESAGTGGRVTPGRPGHPTPVQHLPAQGAAAHPHLLPLCACPGRRPAPTRRLLALLRRGPGRRHRGLLRHLRRAAGQRGPGQTAWPGLIDGLDHAVRRRPFHPRRQPAACRTVGRHPAGRGHGVPRGPLAVTATAQRGVRRTGTRLGVRRIRRPARSCGRRHRRGP